MKTSICWIGGFVVASSVHGFTVPYNCRDGQWTLRRRKLETNLSPDPQEAPLFAMEAITQPEEVPVVQEQDDNKEQTSKIVAPTSVKKAKASSSLLSTGDETETKQLGATTAAAEMALVKDKVALVQVAESAINDGLESNEEQVEAAATAKSETETASRAQKAEATARALLAVRLDMEAKMLASAPPESTVHKKAELEEVEELEPEPATEAVLEIDQEQVEAVARAGHKRAAEATARALLAARLDMEARQRAVVREQKKAAVTEAALEATIGKEQEDKEQPPRVLVAPTFAQKVEATAGNEQPPPPVDVEQVAASARALLATLEAKQRTKNQAAALEEPKDEEQSPAPTDFKKSEATARALLATRLEMEAKQRAATVVALEQTKTVEARAKDAALDIEREAIVKADVEEASIQKAEENARGLLASRLEMETRQRAMAAQTATAALEQEKDPPKVVTPTDFKEAEANARESLTTHIEMEVKLRAKNQAAATEEQKNEEESPAPTDFIKAEAETPTLHEICDGHGVHDAFEDTITSDRDQKAENALARGDVVIEGMSSNGITAFSSSSASSEDDAWMRERPRLGRGRGSSRRKTREILEMEAQKAIDTSTINDDDFTLRTMIQAATAVESTEIGEEVPQKAADPIDLKNTEATGGALMAAHLELEAKQRAKEQATAEKVEVKSEPAVNTHKGKVKFFNSKRGYGVITPDDSDEALFVHQTAIQYSGYRTLKARERVEFQIEVDEHGRNVAVHVTGPEGGPLLVELRKSKVQNDNEETTETAETGLVTEKDAEVEVAEAAIKDVLESEQGQIEVAAYAENKKAESTARALLATRLEMEAKQRVKKESVTVEQEKTIDIGRNAVVKAETEKARTRRTEANARGLLAARLAMEAKQRVATAMALEQEKVFEMEREAVVRAETDKARTRKSEANVRGLLATRLAMNAKLRAAAAMAFEQEKALEIEREAAVKAETEKARIRKAEASARGLLATRLEMEAKQRAAVAVALAQEKALEIEREAVVRAEAKKVRTRRAEANARGLLASRLNMEAKQRAAAAVALAHEKALEIEREAAVRAETEKTRLRKKEASARGLLAARLEMEAKQRAAAAVVFAQEKALEIEREAAVRFETEKARLRKEEASARGLLASRLEMEAKQRAAAAVALAQEKALEIEREAAVRAETEKARLRKEEASARGLLAARLNMEVKQRAAAAVAFAREKVLEIEREAAVKAVTAKARTQKAESHARGLLSARLEMEAKQQAKVHATAAEEPNDKEEPPAQADFEEAVEDAKLRGENQGATAVKFADTALEQAKQPPKVVAPTDVKKAAATARSFLATCLEVEAKQRAKNQATPAAATAKIVTPSEVAAEVAAAEAAIEAVLEIATEVVLEIEQEQVEAAAKAGLMTDLKKAELPARAFLEARVEMEAKQRTKGATKASAVQEEEEILAQTVVKKAKAASLELLAARLEMEARQPPAYQAAAAAEIALEGDKKDEAEATAKAVFEQEQIETAANAAVQAKKAEARARALLATRLEMEAKLRAVVVDVQTEAQEEAQPVAEVSEHESESESEPEPVAEPEFEGFLSTPTVSEPEARTEEVQADVVSSPEKLSEPEPVRALPSTRLFFADRAIEEAEQALKVITLTDFISVKSTDRALLTTPRLFFANTTLEQEEQPPKVVALNDFKKSEATRLEMEAEQQQAKNKAATATAAADIALAQFKAIIKAVLEIVQKPTKEVTVRASLAPRLEKSKVRTATPIMEAPQVQVEVKALAEVVEPESEPKVEKTEVNPPEAAGKPEPEPKQSEPEEPVKPRAGALVAVNQESIEFTSGLIGGAVGYVVDGPVLAAIVAATANYVSRKQDESNANLMQSLSKMTIEAYNTVARIEAKLQILEKSKMALERTLEKLDGVVDSEAVKQVEDTLAKVTTRVVELNEEYDLVGTGLIALKAIGDLVEKVFIAAEEVNKEYHLTDRATASIKEAVDKTTSGLKWPND